MQEGRVRGKKRVKKEFAAATAARITCDCVCECSKRTNRYFLFFFLNILISLRARETGSFVACTSYVNRIYRRASYRSVSELCFLSSIKIVGSRAMNSDFLN